MANREQDFAQMLLVELPDTDTAGEDVLAEALQNALDKTTPERAGCPWDGEPKPTQYSDDDLERDLIEKAYTGRSIVRGSGHYQDES